VVATPERGLHLVHRMVRVPESRRADPAAAEGIVTATVLVAEDVASAERALIRGIVLNKFRGDPALLGNAMELLEERTGIPTVAIVPMRRHALPEEDAFHHRGEPMPGRINVALLLFPYASNLDEFDPLIHAPGVSVTPIGAGASLAAYDAIILPGSTLVDDENGSGSSQPTRSSPWRNWRSGSARRARLAPSAKLPSPSARPHVTS
jgi:hypothetical protein